MTEPYYNPSYGLGIEGFFNYANTLVDGWMALLFLAFIWIVTVFTLSKSDLKMPGVIAFAFFLTFIASMIMKLFMQVSEAVIFVLAIGMALSVFWAIANGRT